jgi:hypothetical protein
MGQKRLQKIVRFGHECRIHRMQYSREPAWQKSEEHLENVEDKTMLTGIGLKKLTKLYLDEFCLGITRSFRFLSDHFLPRFASHQVVTRSVHQDKKEGWRF